MRKWLFVVLIFQISTLLLADIKVEVRRPDSITPYDCNQPVMVGAKLPIVVMSDSNDFWSGGLFIEDQDRVTGLLQARSYDPNRLLYNPNRSQYGVTPYIEDYSDSHLLNAGGSARVTAWEDSLVQGFDLYTTEINDSNFSSGYWFVIDYNAIEVGDCNIGFYDYSISWTEPQEYIRLTNVPTRNFNKDPNQNVDFLDYTIFASRWRHNNCITPSWCEGADLNRDSYVDSSDLGLFADYWLWNNTYVYISKKQKSYLQDPNIIYRVVDVSGANEITLDVNESITLYVDLATTDEKDIESFYIEIDISNSNLGSIDNTQKPGGTAKILARPDRIRFMDYWAPGIAQQEGIQLSGRTNRSAIQNGHLARFVYTSLAEGDVTLDLINFQSYDPNHNPVYPKLEDIIIHQLGPDSQPMMESSAATQEAVETQITPPPEPTLDMTPV
ncbi:MAG: hypothetical protein ACYSUK_03985, partial [Planctomycetota bacterium]